MRCNQSVTVYHFEEEAQAYCRFYVTGAWVHRTLKLSAESRGFLKKPALRLRIPLAELSDGFVDLGDYVFLGKTEAAVPDKHVCHKVIEVSENRCGANPHVRIFAE